MQLILFTKHSIWWLKKGFDSTALIHVFDLCVWKGHWWWGQASFGQNANISSGPELVPAEPFWPTLESFISWTIPNKISHIGVHFLHYKRPEAVDEKGKGQLVCKVCILYSAKPFKCEPQYIWFAAWSEVVGIESSGIWQRRWCRPNHLQVLSDSEWKRKDSKLCFEVLFEFLVLVGDEVKARFLTSIITSRQ